METEELGSVYESLLELTPRLTDDGRGFAFAEGGETKGNARKTTGSYYTPDSLVQMLLDSALDPVLDRVEAEADDPAASAARRSRCSTRPAAPAISCSRRRGGSRRGWRDRALAASPRRRTIATRCATWRAPASIGVDRNPMAVELCKVALWIETVGARQAARLPRRHIRCGDSLIGVFDLNALIRHS